MQITILEESNISDWEHHLKNVSASPFISARWLESFKDPCCNPIYFQFISDGITVGLAAGLGLEPPHPSLRKIFRKLFLFSGPAFVQSNPEMEKASISQLIDYASENNYTHLEMRSYDYTHTIDFENLPFIKEDRDEYIIDLSPEWSDIKRKMRKSISEQKKLGEKNGLTFHESHSPELIDDLVTLLEQTKQRRLSKGYKDYSYYYIPYLNQDVLSQLLQKEIARIFYVRAGAKIICVIFVVAYYNKANALLIGSTKEAYALRAPAFVWYKMIEKLKTEGFEYLNMGGVPEDSSKENMVFAKTSLGAVEYLCSGGKTPHLNGRFYNLMNIIYTKLPSSNIKKIIAKSISGRS